eukprot:TRINITY_DN8206_c0_g1_i4.p1 TRINITY_DN8206_c0_g1~~TRINITY_DN8206_c0_g1_i4.p1  ORF type:complete len:187 (+),score=62.40 TRINITY_DN8206_c0_g1_i4:61-561(+)
MCIRDRYMGRPLVLRFPHLTDTLNRLDTLVGAIYQIYYGSRIQEPLDFHYLLEKIEAVASSRNELFNVVAKFVSKETPQEELHKALIRAKENSESLQNTIESWKSIKTYIFNDQKNIDARKKMIAAKWIESSKISKLRKIAEKRAGLRKQKYLADKAERIKAFKKL